MNEKVASLLGFAQRANKLVSGESAVKALMKKGRIHLLLIALDMSDKAAGNYRLWCEDMGIPVLRLGAKEELGRCLGQSPRGLIGVLDEGFARSILAVADKDQGKISGVKEW